MIRTPYIVRETAAGLERLAIPDILFQLREVQFIAGFTELSRTGWPCMM